MRRDRHSGLSGPWTPQVVSLDNPPLTARRQTPVMATRERLVDRGRARGRHLIADAGRGLRDGRRDRGLSLAKVGRAIGLSRSQVSRIERGLIAGVTVAELAVLHAAVGLDLTLRAYPGGQPLRDAAQAALLSDLRADLHRSLRWAVEVPLPAPGDQRSWDAMIVGRRPSSAADVVIWRHGVEAEMVPRDGQALIRRIQ